MENNPIALLKEKAEKLYDTRKQLEALKESYNTTKDPLEALRDQLQEELLKEFTSTGLDSFKVNGDTFSKSSRPSIKIVSEAAVLPWAIEVAAVAIDKDKLRDILKRHPELTPEGIEIVEREFISVRKAKSDDKEI